MKKWLYCLWVAFLLVWMQSISAQSLPPFKAANTHYRAVTRGNYLGELNEENANLKIRRLSIDSANANVKDAGKPYLSPILTYVRGSMYTQAPYSGYTNPASNTLGAMVTIEGLGQTLSQRSTSRCKT
jgi:hypothetical protein